jgi:hypothetical protein
MMYCLGGLDKFVIVEIFKKKTVDLKWHIILLYLHKKINEFHFKPTTRFFNTFFEK